MSKFSKVLSVLLAMVFVFSTMTIGVEAVSVSNYKDGAIKNYNAIGDPVLSTEQYASMAMDELDRMLQEMNFVLDVDIGGFIKLPNERFTSIDEALDSIADIYDRVGGALSQLGDLQDLSFNALTNAPRRGTTGDQDLDIFLAVFQFLSDNVSVLSKLPYGSYKENVNPNGLNIGIAGNFIDLSDYVDLIALIKKPVAKIVWPDRKEAELDLTKTLDQYVEILIDEVANGTYPSEKGTIKRVSELVHTYLPGITDEIDLLNDTVYDIIAKGFKIAINAVGVVKANQYFPTFLKMFCGYSFDKGKDKDGDPVWTPAKDYDDNVNRTRESVVNINFNMPNIDTSSWSNVDIVDHVNDVLGVIVKEAVNPAIKNEIVWTNGGNENLTTNIINTAKVILSHTGDDFFASFVEVKTPEELDAMSEDEFIAYILRSIFNGSIDDVYIDNSVDTMEGVLFEFIRSLAASQIPSQNYDSLEPSIDNMIAMGLDIAAYWLNTVTDMQLSYGLDVDEFADACMDWVIENYGGFVSDVDGSGWTALSYVFNKIIPADWLPLRDGSERDNLYDILYYDIAENLINDDQEVKLDAILDLARRNDDGELNHTLLYVLLHRVVDIINYVIPGVFPDGTYNTLEGLLDKSLLSQIIAGLIDGLNDRASTPNANDKTLADSLLPVVCMALGLSSPETFGNPYISLEDITTLNPTITSTFYMYNGSSGINTNTRDKSTGKFKTTPDELYTYKINSTSTNIPGLNAVYSGSAYIKGGETKTFTFNGTSSLEQHEGELLIVTITYDVYEEEGGKMTTVPLTATTYSYISSQKDDGDEEKVLRDGKTSQAVKYKWATYISPKTELGDIADITIDITRDYYTDVRKFNQPAVINVTRAEEFDLGQVDKLSDHGVTYNTNFSVNTTREGGKWEWKPYVVPAAHAKDTLEPGIYQMNFAVHAGKTDGEQEGTVAGAHYIVVYDDSGLKSLVNRAVSANRQQSNYATSGSFPVKYTAFENLNIKLEEGEEAPDPVEYEVDASGVWDNYIAALQSAAMIVYAPRQVNNYADQDFLDGFAAAAEALYVATQELEACASTDAGGVQAVQNALDAVIIPDYSDEVDSEGNPIRVDYDDPDRTYFDREDYLSYTYSNFKKARKAADRLIDSVKEAEKKGETVVVAPVDAAYRAHRVSLYGNRLIRVVANKQHLASAIAKYGSIQQGEYSTESWNAYTKALAFAQSVNNEPIGEYYNNPNAENYLFLKNQAITGTLRQSKVNRARAELIDAAKRLVVSTMVDYTKLNTALANAKSIYEAGAANWTTLSWNTFKTAYENGVALVAQELEKTTENQRIVNDAADTLDTARGELTANSGPSGSYYFDCDTMITFESDIWENPFLTGLDLDDPWTSDWLYTEGDWDYEIEYNSMDTESTGAVLYIYDGNGDVVEEYNIVLFGDVDGNALVDGEDAMQVGQYCAAPSRVHWGEFDDVDENPYAFAADVTHDYVVDGQDYSCLKDNAYGFLTVNQEWSYDNWEIYA